MINKKGVVLGAVGGVLGFVGLAKLYGKGYDNGVKTTTNVYDTMFDMFRELEKAHEKEDEAE